MEVVIVIQPDDWEDLSDVGHRIFGVFKSVLAAEAAIRKAVEKKADDEEWAEEADNKRKAIEDEIERFHCEVCDVDERSTNEI